MVGHERLAWTLAGAFTTAFFVLVGWIVEPLFRSPK